MIPEVRLQVVAALGFDLVVLKDVEMSRLAAGRGRQREFSDLAETVLVAAGDLTPARDVGLVGLQLDVQKGGLQIVEPRVQSPADDFSLLVAPVVAQLRDA